VAASCEQGDEPSGPITGGEFIDQLRDYKRLKIILFCEFS